MYTLHTLRRIRLPHGTRSLARFSTEQPKDVMSTSTSAPDSDSKSKLLHSFKDLTDEQVVDLVRDGTVSQYKLERELKKAVLAGLEPDCKRAVRVRRLWLESEINTLPSHITDDERRQRNVGPLFTGELESAKGLPYADFDFNNFYVFDFVGSQISRFPKIWISRFLDFPIPRFPHGRPVGGRG